MNSIAAGIFRPVSCRIAPISSSSSSSITIKTVKVSIKGKVQGVFFRDWTVENANELGVKGWVRNRRDDFSVEALFSGETNKVDEMTSRCHRGPPTALVTAVSVYAADPAVEDPGNSFRRSPTV